MRRDERGGRRAVHCRAPPAPPSVDANAFNQYLAAAQAAPGQLQLLRTGLPNRLQASGFDPIFPVGSGDDSYPFNIVYTSEPDPAHPGGSITVSHIPICTFHPQDNLSDLSQFRIQEFDYLPAENVSTSSPCALELAGTRQNEILGRVLGWHAGSIDDHVNDSVMWFKPTNAAGFSIVNQYANTATNLLIGAVVFPFYCVANLFQGKSLSDACNPGDVYALADKYNPIEQIEGLTPGLGDARSDKFTGLWHFIDVDAGSGVHNRVRGMSYLGAGPNTPGAFDLAIVAGADTVGLSLNAYAADGDDFYGKYDEVKRIGPAPWMVYSIAHIEFSPLDNLAQYGWDKFLSSGGKGAEGLAWPLHAIGDACEPHHVAGTSAWGHRPYEDAVDDRLDEFMPTKVDERNAQMTRILTEGARWWQWLKGNSDMRPFIEFLATEVSTDIAQQLDWPYSEIAFWRRRSASERSERRADRR
jgi:hypothetical protein